MIIMQCTKNFSYDHFRDLGKLFSWLGHCNEEKMCKPSKQASQMCSQEGNCKLLLLAALNASYQHQMLVIAICIYVFGAICNHTFVKINFVFFSCNWHSRRSKSGYIFSTAGKGICILWCWSRRTWTKYLIEAFSLLMCYLSLCIGFTCIFTFSFIFSKSKANFNNCIPYNSSLSNHSKFSKSQLS